MNRFFRKKLKKLLKWWRLRNWNILGIRILRQEKVLPLSIQNLRRGAFYARQLERVKNIPGAIVECGVWKGKSIFMLAALAEPEREVWGFDTFAGFPGISEFDRKEVAELQNFRDTSLPMVRKFLEFNKTPNVKLIEGTFQETLARHKKDIGPIALLHIDGDLHDSYKTCLNELYAQVAKGGVIIFDEYKNSWELEEWPGAARAIDEFFKPRGLTPLTDDLKAILIKP